MNQCKCGSFAFNLAQDGIDQCDLCDRHYWQDRAEKAEKDAARYREVRRGQNWSVINGIGDDLRGEVLDAAADVVIAAHREQS